MRNEYLPKDTFDLNLNSNQIDNFALRLNKFPKIYKKQNELHFALNYHEHNKKKSVHIDCEVNRDFKDSKNKILSFTAKYLHSLEQIPNLKLETSFFKPDWKLILGLGSPSVYETSITLHHIYGFPYIPGQAVKGVVRNYVINEYFAQNEKEAEKDEQFVNIFGAQKQQGKVIFFDAYPISEPKIDFDIMNVHYPNYYSGNNEPTDDQNPNPITFLTVRDTKFVFAVGVNKDNNGFDFSNFKEKSVMELLKSVLEESGFGAKTSVGYGFFFEQEDKSFPEYNNLIKKENEELEKNKPYYQKLIENISISIDEAIKFIQNNNNSKEIEAVTVKLKEYFLDEDVWKEKELNRQHFDFAQFADNFFEIIAETDDKIIKYIKKYGSKKLQKKFEFKSKNNYVNSVKIPSDLSQIEEVMLQFKTTKVSYNDFLIIEKKINTLFKKDKKNKMKEKKKKKILKELSDIKSKF